MQVKQRVSALRGGQSANLTAGTVNHQSAFAAARSDRTENRRQTCGNLANPEKTPGHPDNCTIPYNIDASPPETRHQPRARCSRLKAYERSAIMALSPFIVHVEKKPGLSFGEI